MSISLHSKQVVERLKSDAIAAVVLDKLQDALMAGGPGSWVPLCRAIEGIEGLLAAGVSPREMYAGMGRIRVQLSRAEAGL